MQSILTNANMKIYYSLFIIIVSFSITKSQAPDFTQTDIYGNTFNLYEQLDQGKTVVLDFFSYY